MPMPYSVKTQRLALIKLYQALSAKPRIVISQHFKQLLNDAQPEEYTLRRLAAPS
jgi:hypothetical protein